MLCDAKYTSLKERIQEFASGNTLKFRFGLLRRAKIAQWVIEFHHSTITIRARGAAMQASLQNSLPTELLENKLLAPPQQGGEGCIGCSENDELANPQPLAVDSRWRRRIPAYLVSLIVHTTFLLVLALWAMRPTEKSGDRFVIDVRSDPQPNVSQIAELQLTDGIAGPAPAAPMQQDSAVEITGSVSSITTLAHVLNAQAIAENPASEASEIDGLIRMQDGGTSISFAGSGIEGRRSESRRQLAMARGGSVESERAVELALQWLAAHQQPNGSWSLVHQGGECRGRCPNNGSKERFEPAATGLALLAFLGAGYTHQSGKYQSQVKSGIYFLLQILDETEHGGSLMHGCDRGMYNHGIAAFALCEAYQMSGDLELKKAAQQAVDFITHAQNQAGGWGYLPKQPGDLTISTWQVMALKSAAAAGLNLRPGVALRLDNFLDTQTNAARVYYGYGKPGKQDTCTALGLLLRLFRNWPNTDPRVLEGTDFLFGRGISNHDAYFNYYATLLFFHAGSHHWSPWNQRMREYLIQTQRQNGHETGSWYFDNPFGKEGGRLYTTAMCAMTLEVYYRFQPVYQQADKNFEL